MYVESESALCEGGAPFLVVVNLLFVQMFDKNIEIQIESKKKHLCYNLNWSSGIYAGDISVHSIMLRSQQTVTTHSLNGAM